ncbi:CaiB/BaiF CoA transferase family protein [Mycolicibacterium hodleri]|uniref:CoA transferase n=1 Tax=Mycolicibacterium hodleri TaxID=49897 RepID=A0A502E783_9MYCO|nr:CaiB/BaiF CoA-transferase family protein [Mycolicibacterium hodleri]TPG32396.1 CoA transferase [Mycolicibacterium hodleri]
MSLVPNGPLTGLRIVELAGIGPGPFAAMLLADMGADVIRVERPSSSGSVILPDADPLRRSRPSVTIDLRSPRGIATVLDLIAQADVLIEGFRPGVTESMGLGPQDCWNRNPRLIYGRMTGWGQDGPLSSVAGHDISYIAITGALHAMGRSGEAPAVPLNLVGDFGGGSLYLVMGILAAVYESQRSGTGQIVDAAIVDGAASLTTILHGLMGSGQWRDERGVNLLDTGMPWYDVYETADGGHVAVGALEQKFYDTFIRTLGISDVADRSDPSQWPRLRQQIAAVFATKGRDEWAAIFNGSDACVAPVLGLLEAPHHPHLQHRATFVDIDGVRQPAPAPRFSRTPSSVQKPPRPSGTETRKTLERWSIDDVDALISDGVAIETH